MTRIDNTAMSTEEKILKELKKISKVILISNGDKLQIELEKYATTNERKKIWIQINGERQTADIAKLTGSSLRTVQAFLKILEDAQLIDERRHGEAPKRSFDYVPPKWFEMVFDRDISKPEEDLNTESNIKKGN